MKNFSRLLIGALLFLGLITVQTSATAELQNSSRLLSRPGYDYGPSIIYKNEAEIRIWWCGIGQPDNPPLDPNFLGTDVIYYGVYNKRTLSWTSGPTIVMKPDYSSSTWEHYFNCDPSVIAGHFVNPDDPTADYTLAMYYTGTDDLGPFANGANTRIGVAFSKDDGVTWSKYSQNPIIYPLGTKCHNPYGAGQPATYSVDGYKGVWMLYTDTTRSDSISKVMLAKSPDGIHFCSPTPPAPPMTMCGTIPMSYPSALCDPPVEVSNSGIAGQPGSMASMANPDFAFDDLGGYWYATFASDSYRHNLNEGETFEFGLYRMKEMDFPLGTWEPLGFFNTARTGNPINCNAGIVRDQYGRVNFSLPNIQIAFAGGNPSTDTWDLWTDTWLAFHATDALNRYNDLVTARHWVTTGYAPAESTFETTLGYLFTGKQPNTVPLYGCLNITDGTDQFVTTDFNCEGQYQLGIMGYIGTLETINSRPVYRCRQPGPGHFVSTRADCEAMYGGIKDCSVAGCIPLLGFVQNGPT